MGTPVRQLLWLLVTGLFVGLAQGCAVAHVGTSLHGTPATTRMLGTVDLGTRIHQVRGQSPVFGSELTIAQPKGGSFGFRNLRAMGGYRTGQLGPLRLELGAETGIGEPALVNYDSNGLYLGGYASLLVRLSGSADEKVGYAPVGILIDLVLTGRGGHWIPGPMDPSAPVDQGVLQVAIRLTAITDFIVASDDRWKER